MEKKLFRDLINSIERGIGFYNPVLRVYALKNEGNACKKIWEYLCKKCDEGESNPQKANLRLREIDRKTETIFSTDKIDKLTLRAYTKI